MGHLKITSLRPRVMNMSEKIGGPGQELLIVDVSSHGRENLQETKGDVTRDDLHRRLLAQQSVAMLEQRCNYSQQCCNAECCAKNRLV